METKPSLSNKTYTLYKLKHLTRSKSDFKFVLEEVQSFSTLSEVIFYVENRWVNDETEGLFIQENDKEPQPYYVWTNFYYNAYKRPKIKKTNSK